MVDQHMIVRVKVDRTTWANLRRLSTLLGRSAADLVGEVLEKYLSSHKNSFNGGD